ncbi:hypothetical protein [Mesobacillus subterraneus]|uniref:Uncharacterized protein n=1 Tax=Mesobacillus subterraneus TaxID=285983 RepID=A0A427TY32_9BACI|nr:hypothetical protein [Mesobacillus subterraneus]RSD29447.1 hypothetical protein EJA10_02055 [Mesobacillus subterraneus]
MFLYNLFVFFSLGVLLLLSAIFAVWYKKQLAGMAGMMISMYIGMNIGLTSGILLGTVFQGSLFLSTLLAMLIAVLSGTLIGFMFSTSAAIEGMMAGMMGGMMGAMLGEMIPPHQTLILVNIFLTISLSGLFLFNILSRKESSVKSKSDFVKPGLLLAILTIYLIAGSQLGYNWVNDLQKGQGQHHQH